MNGRWIPSIFIFLFLISQTSASTLLADETITAPESKAEEKAPTEAPPAPEAGDKKKSKKATAKNKQAKKSKGKPMMKIETVHGTIEIEFYPKDAPKTVARISELVKKGFYNGLTFHRVVPGFVVQGGDPVGNGTGGSGVKLQAEFNKQKHEKGTLAMARAQDPNSADSQFYIALDRIPHLDNNYTIFGKVVKGMDAVEKIQIGDKMTKVSLE